MGTGYVVESWCKSHRVGPMDPLEPQHIGPRGPPIASWTTDCSVWSMDCVLRPVDHRTPKSHKGPKSPKMALNQDNSKLAIVMAKAQNHWNGPKWPQGPSYSIFQ
ncbi:hypothetical protein O181_017800 [Austropuccinia psidii MF-1]|uniref:Uncharacterized protein n=1 Tax=Austropuccinia psidii MF-1 TaxID=1389203 RepID=A0A9Q3C7G2_9BASI|nr:hypothetical protein [Austropuccinia psidii MF-1]